MMYKHEIDEQISRLKDDKRRMMNYGQYEQALFIQDKIDSWYRVKEKAFKAKIGAPIVV